MRRRGTARQRHSEGPSSAGETWSPAYTGPPGTSLGGRTLSSAGGQAPGSALSGACFSIPSRSREGWRGHARPRWEAGRGLAAWTSASPQLQERAELAKVRGQRGRCGATSGPQERCGPPSCCRPSRPGPDLASRQGQRPSSVSPRTGGSLLGSQGPLDWAELCCPYGGALESRGGALPSPRRSAPRAQDTAPRGAPTETPLRVL